MVEKLESPSKEKNGLLTRSSLFFNVEIFSIYARCTWKSVCLHARTVVTPECMLAPLHTVHYAFKNTQRDLNTAPLPD